MAQYCVNRDAQSGSRDHEVHNLDVATRCLPSPPNRIALGDHSSCQSAVEAAKQHFDDTNGCAYCAPDCHTS